MKIIELLDFENLTIEQVRDLEKVTIEMQNEYNQLIEELSKNQTIGALWWTTSIASRNVFQSPLFVHCAHLSLVYHYLENGHIIDRINCTNRYMRGIVKEFVIKNGYDIEITSSKNSSKKSIKNILLFIYLMLYSMSMLYCTLRYKNKYRDYKNKDLVLIDMFAIDSTINKSGYKERYFNGILDYFNEKEKEDVFMFPTVIFSLKNYIKNYRLLVNAKDPQFLTNESLLKLRDYFLGWEFLTKVFFHSYRETTFKRFNVRKLLEAESRRGLINCTTYLSFLQYKAITRMKEKGLKVRVLLDWFENHPIDKVTYYGFNTFFPDTTTIAYSGFVGELKAHSYAIPTELETKNHMVPKFLAVMGTEMIVPMRKFGITIPIVVAPAFRFKELWESDISIGKNIVITLPLEKHMRNRILTLLPDVFEIFQDKKIMVKKHPADNSDYSKLINNYRNLMYSEDPFPKLMEDCAVLISSSSSTCLEAVARGIPVVVIRDCYKITVNIILDTIPKDIWELCYDANELIKAISRFINIDQERKNYLKKIGNAIRDSYFEKLERESVRKLFMLDN